MAPELARLTRLLTLADETEREAERASESHKREKLTQLSVRYREMAAAIMAPGVHRIDRGLYLQIKGGNRSWVHRYQFGGKARWSGLGAADRVMLAQARARR